MTALEEAKRDLAIANRILANQGVLDAFGHVSVRHPQESGLYLMARSLAPHLVTADDIVTFDLDSQPKDDGGRPLYAERPIHGCIYQARADVTAVCHNHAHSLIPFGVTANPLRPIFHMASVIGEDVPIWDIADEFGATDMLVTTNEMGASLARCLGHRAAVLMRGHGSTVVGRTLKEAVFRAYYLMVNAGLLTQAATLGGDIRFLSQDEIAKASATLSEPLSQERAWEGWSADAGLDARKR